jgi:hypothetical protein
MGQQPETATQIAVRDLTYQQAQQMMYWETKPYLDQVRYLEALYTTSRTLATYEGRFVGTETIWTNQSAKLLHQYLMTKVREIQEDINKRIITTCTY